MRALAVFVEGFGEAAKNARAVLFALIFFSSTPEGTGSL
jgi:hypothetical protein